MRKKIEKLKIKFFQKLSSIRGRSGLASSSPRRSGSVLVYALMVLSLILIVTLSLSAVTIIERKSSSVTGKSTVSFQAADSGVEIISQIIYSSDSTDTVYDAFAGKTKTPPLTGDLCNPVGSLLDGTLSDKINGRDYVVTLYDSAGSSAVKINCYDDGTSPDQYTVAFIKKIQSIGIYSGTTRAVETAIAQTSSYKGCNTPSTVASGAIGPISLLDNAGKNLCTDGNGCQLRVACDLSVAARETTAAVQFFYQNLDGTWARGTADGLNGDASKSTVYGDICNTVAPTDIDIVDDIAGCTQSADNLCVDGIRGIKEVTIMVCD